MKQSKSLKNTLEGKFKIYKRQSIFIEKKIIFLIIWIGLQMYVWKLKKYQKKEQKIKKLPIRAKRNS